MHTCYAWLPYVEGPISQRNNTFLINIYVCIYIHIYERDDRTGVYILKPDTELGEPLYFFFSPIKTQLNQVQKWISADSKHSLKN